jgi:hypothetical protein
MLPEYFPIYEVESSAPIFLFIKDRMEQLIKGKDALAIDRLEFESHLIKNDDLSEIYFELFSLTAKFYKCRFEYDGILTIYYIMFERRIKLIYFRKIEIQNVEIKDSRRHSK